MGEGLASAVCHILQLKRSSAPGAKGRAFDTCGKAFCSAAGRMVKRSP